MAQRLRLAVCALMVTAGCGGPPIEELQEPFELDTSLTTCDWQYDRPLEEIKRAVLTALRWSGFLLSSEHYDGLGGEWIARRPDGPQVTLTATSAEPRQTSVAIRIDSGNGELVRFLGKRLSEELGKSPNGQAEPGRAAVVGSYACEVRGGLEAGERTCQILDFFIVNEVRSGEDAHLDALTESGSSIRMIFASQRSPRGTIRVTVTTDTVNDDDNRCLAFQVSKVFAKQVMTSER